MESSTGKRAWRRWTDDEERLLAQTVLKLGTKAWDKITQEMRTPRTAKQLQDHWSDRQAQCLQLFREKGPIERPGGPHGNMQSLASKRKNARNFVPTKQQPTPRPVVLEPVPSLRFRPHPYVQVPAAKEAAEEAYSKRVRNSVVRYLTHMSWIENDLFPASSHAQPGTKRNDEGEQQPAHMRDDDGEGRASSNEEQRANKRAGYGVFVKEEPYDDQCNGVDTSLEGGMRDAANVRNVNERRGDLGPAGSELSQKGRMTPEDKLFVVQEELIQELADVTRVAQGLHNTLKSMTGLEKCVQKCIQEQRAAAAQGAPQEEEDSAFCVPGDVRRVTDASLLGWVTSMAKDGMLSHGAYVDLDR